MSTDQQQIPTKSTIPTIEDNPDKLTDKQLADRESRKNKRLAYKESRDNRNLAYNIIKDAEKKEKAEAKAKGEEWEPNDEKKVGRKINCSCGSVVSEKNLTSHVATNKHKKLLEEKTKQESKTEVSTELAKTDVAKTDVDNKQKREKVKIVTIKSEPVEEDEEDDGDDTIDDKIDDISDSLDYITYVVRLIAEVLELDVPDDVPEEFLDQ